MTTQLTLTIEDSVVNSAEEYAQQTGSTLSDIVENYLKAITVRNRDVTKLSPQIRELMGVIKLPEDFDYKKELADALEKKYRGNQ